MTLADSTAVQTASPGWPVPPSLFRSALDLGALGGSGNSGRPLVSPAKSKVCPFPEDSGRGLPQSLKGARTPRLTPQTAWSPGSADHEGLAWGGEWGAVFPIKPC